VVWAVLNPAYTRLAMQQLAPEVGQFPEAAKLVGRMQNMIINVEASSGLDGKFQAVADRPMMRTRWGSWCRRDSYIKSIKRRKTIPTWRR